MTTKDISPTRVAELGGMSHSEAKELGRREHQALVELLDDLSEDDWNKVTDCDPWTVRDIVAHLLGWAEATTSPKAFFAQTKATRRVAKEFGAKLDAQNQAQVEMRKDMSSAELVEALRRSNPKFLKLRGALGAVGKPVPMYNGTLGWTTVGFLADVIFLRDHFMHRIDITRAVGRDFRFYGHEGRIVADVVRHWNRLAKPDARLVLTGDAGGDFLLGTEERTTITGDALEYCRLLSGRAEPSTMEVEGDEYAARSYLSVPVPF
jgi:uncharacterized protein (TIGR03083 family)